MEKQEENKNKRQPEDNNPQRPENRANAGETRETNDLHPNHAAGQTPDKDQKPDLNNYGTGPVPDGVIDKGEDLPEERVDQTARNINHGPSGESDGDFASGRNQNEFSRSHQNKPGTDSGTNTSWQGGGKNYNEGSEEQSDSINNPENVLRKPEQGTTEYQKGPSDAGIGMPDIRNEKDMDKWGSGSGEGLGKSNLENDKLVQDTEKRNQRTGGLENQEDREDAENLDSE
jgi:hypothetical protein